MSKKALTTLALLTVLITVSVPVFFAIYLARDIGLEAEANRTLVYARDTLHRSERTTDQMAAGIARLQAAQDPDPCSDRNIALMGDIELASSYIQTMGYAQSEHLICSSLGRYPAPGLPLGPVDMVSGNGVAMRMNVQFPSSGNNRFIVAVEGGFAAVLHKDLPIDTNPQERDALLATFMLDNRMEVTARGAIDPNWLDAVTDAAEATFTDDGYVVAVVRSERYRIGSVAAMPLSYFDQRARTLILQLVPIGLIAGVVMSLAVLHLARSQMAFPSVIKSGLRNREFFMAYQPIVELASGKIVGAEALIRWRRRTGELLRPDLFIPVAEEAGLINAITRRVIELIGEDAATLFKRWPHFHIAINLSASDLGSEDIAAALEKLATLTGAGAGNLVLEATERGFINPEAIRAIVDRLRKQGMRVAIDDFGTGYSSLSTLQQLPLDALKIDKSFVNTLGMGVATSQVIVHIIDMAKDLKLDMVAEGIESEEQASFLRAHGLQFAQGWLFGKPMSMSELKSLLERG